MSEQSYIGTAGNVIPPIYHLIVEKGYDIRIEGDNYIAENEKAKFLAYDIVELAALIFLYENKGDNWRVSDDKIDEYVDKFC